MKTKHVLFLLFVCMAVGADDPISGWWSFSSKESTTGIVRTNDLLVLRGGDGFKVFDRAEDGSWKSLKTGRTDGDGAIIEVPGLASRTNITIKVNFEKGVWSGRDLEERRYAVEGMRARTTWLCGNHVPTNHLAATQRARQESTKRYGCAQWDVLNDANATAVIPVLTAKAQKGTPDIEDAAVEK